MLFYWEFLPLFPIQFSNKRHRKLVFYLHCLPCAEQVLSYYLPAKSCSVSCVSSLKLPLDMCSWSFLPLGDLLLLLLLSSSSCDSFLPENPLLQVLPSSLSYPVTGPSLLLISQTLGNGDYPLQHIGLGSAPRSGCSLHRATEPSF